MPARRPREEPILEVMVSVLPTARFLYQVFFKNLLLRLPEVNIHASQEAKEGANIASHDVHTSKGSSISE
jgi:hypothetical protein